MDEERDLVVFTDDEGNELTLEILDYFFYNGQEYAVLTEYDPEGPEDATAQEKEEESLYIMQVIPVDDETEEFVPVDDSIMDKLIDIVMTRFDADGDDEEEDEEEE